MTTPGALATATAAAERARELVATTWRDLDGAQAIAVTETLCSAKTLLDAALLRAIERVEETDALRELGWASARDYLTHLLGGHKGTGGGLIRAVEQLRELPAVQDALEKGEVTLPQARAIAGKVQTLPRVPEFRETVAAKMLELVATHGHDATDLHRAFDDVVREVDPDGTIINAEKERAKRERAVHHSRYLTFAEDRYGGVRVAGYGTPEDAERIKTALLPLAAPVTSEAGACGGRARGADEPLFDIHGGTTGIPCHEPGCSHQGRDPRHPGKRMWDALVDVCDRVLTSSALPRDHGATPKVVVLIDQESLRQRIIDAGLAQTASTPTGTRLSAQTTRRLACDAQILPAVLGAQSQVLDVGRAQRLVTPALWHALLVRDRHCAFPACSRPPLACDAHHITHWADGGTTDLDNLIMVCRHHHNVLHQTPWAVHIDPQTHQPVWRPPPRLTLDNLNQRATYAPARARPPGGSSPPHAA